MFFVPALNKDLRFIRSSQHPDTFSDIWKETFFDFQIQSFDANWFLLWISISTKLYHINEILWRYVGIWGTQNMRTSKTKTFWRYGIGGAHFDLLWLENKLKSLLPWQVWCISVCSHLFIAEFILYIATAITAHNFQKHARRTTLILRSEDNSTFQIHIGQIHEKTHTKEFKAEIDQSISW